MILDAQSARAATGVPAVTMGKDAAKRVPCPERGLAADVLSLVITVVLVAASVHDNATGTALLDPVAGDSVSKAPVDQGFENQVVTHGAALGIDVEIVRRNPEEQGFVPHLKRRRGADVRDPDTAPAPGPRLRTSPGLLRLTHLLGHDPRRSPPAHRREHTHLVRSAGGRRVNLAPLLQALGLQEDAARALTDDLRTRIDTLQAQPREAELHGEHLAVTRTTIHTEAEPGTFSKKQ